MWRWIMECIVAVGDIILYILKELRSIKIWTMIYLLHLLKKCIESKYESVALQIIIPIVFGYLFYIRAKEKHEERN